MPVPQNADVLGGLQNRLKPGVVSIHDDLSAKQEEVRSRVRAIAPKLPDTEDTERSRRAGLGSGVAYCTTSPPTRLTVPPPAAAGFVTCTS